MAVNRNKDENQVDPSAFVCRWAQVMVEERLWGTVGVFLQTTRRPAQPEPPTRKSKSSKL